MTEIDRPNPPRRNRRGGLAKGVSGSLAGRPAGSLNEATRIAALLLGGKVRTLARKAIELALAGDIAALWLCLDGNHRLSFA